MENSEKSLKIRVILVTLAVFCFLKFLDWGLFQKIYFQFPNEMEWDTSPWYNFIHHIHKIPNTENKDRVLIAGSSVALYSVLPGELQIKNRTNFLNDVHLYSHVAMAPTDLYFYLDDILSKKPKMVVYILNPADLQMDFVSEVNGSFVYNNDDWLSHFSWRHPTRLFYPWEFSLDYSKDLSNGQIFRLWGKSLLYVNRYREFIKDPIDKFIERNYRKGRSYHIYTGAVPLEGIWQHGWTNPKFSLVCEFSNGEREEMIFIPHPESTLTIQHGNRDPQEIYFTKSGWHAIQLKSGSDIAPIQFEINKTYSSKIADKKPYGKEFQYGIRLTQNFCRNRRQRNLSYKRPNYLEESRFRAMNLREYELDYYERLYRDADQRPELTRMIALSNAKEILNRHEFVTWVEIERIQIIQKKLEESGVRFLLVLSPENPLELKKYNKSSWYLGFLDYLGEKLGGHFYDHSGLLYDPRFFSDPHHLTYEGANKFTKVLGKIIEQEFVDGD